MEIAYIIHNSLPIPDDKKHYIYGFDKKTKNEGFWPSLLQDCKIER